MLNPPQAPRVSSFCDLLTVSSKKSKTTVRLLQNRTLIARILVAGLGLIVSQAKGQSTFTTASGNQMWGVAANWSPAAIPNAIDASVIFLTPVGGNQAISSFGLARTVGSMAITNNSTNTFSITTSNILTFDVASGNASLTVAGTGNVTNTFNASLDVVLNDNLALAVTNTATTAPEGALRINGIISGTGRIIKSGQGTVTLTNSGNSFSGGVTLEAGVLRITVGAAIGPLPAQYVPDQIVLNGGTLQYGANGTFTSGANRGFSVGSAGGTMDIPSAAASYTISAIVANVSGQSGSLTKTGNGTLTLNAASTYSGGTTVAKGTLQVGVSGSLGSASSTVRLGSVGGGNASLISYLGGYTYAQDIVVAEGSGGDLTLGYTSTAAFSANFSGDITLNDDLILNSESADGFAMRLTGTITGAHDLTKTGVGTVRIEENNSGYSGVTTISEGILQLGSASGSTAGALGFGQIINNAILRVNRSNTFELSNAISGTGSLIQTGSGVTTLSAANTYSGGTNLANGGLLATNTTGSATGSGPLIASTGTTLGGTGRIILGGMEGASIAGRVAPGLAGVNDGVGILTLGSQDGQIIFQNGASLDLELRANGSNDRLVFAGAGAGFMDFSALAPGSLVVDFVGGYTPALGHSFDLLDWTSLSGPGVVGLNGSLLNLSTDGFDSSWVWDTSLFSSSGVIMIALVPEPSRLAFCGLGTWIFFFRRRRIVG